MPKRPLLPPSTPSIASSSSTASKKATRSSARLVSQQESIHVPSSSGSSITSVEDTPPPPSTARSRPSAPKTGDSATRPARAGLPRSRKDEEDDDMNLAIAASMECNDPRPPVRSGGLPSPAPTNDDVRYGRAGWKKDFEVCRGKWLRPGKIEGYAGMIATISGFDFGDADDSVKLNLQFEDMDGRQTGMGLQLAFQNLQKYPSSYNLVVYADTDVPRRSQTTFSRFVDIYDLDLSALISQLVCSLQGDDEASGGFAPDLDDEDFDMEGSDPWGNEPGQTSGSIRTVTLDFDKSLPLLKKHFEQARSFGYRPGLTRVSDYWVISYSIPLKNLPIDPSLLGMWDDGLVAAWEDDQRLTLLMGVEEYPPHIDKVKYWLGFHKDYKPPQDVVIATTRGLGLQGFFLSSSLLSYLKSFGRCFKLRTTFNLDWTTADSIGLDEERSREFFQATRPPKPKCKKEKKDPIAKGYEENVLLCAFHWVLRRFAEAPKYCLNCGLEVSTPSLRPYVCDKPLCLYSFMSLGLGPSVEHTVQTHSAVVDILLSFAHAAVSGNTRIDMPLELHIELPSQYKEARGVTLLDDLPEISRRPALKWLIEQLPKISEIKAHLDNGCKLKNIEAPAGSIGVLRWVIGSCRAYLKETKPDEGVVNNFSPAVTNLYNPSSGNIKQFLFVVGSPEQESNFKAEVEAAQRKDEHCVEFPTLLAFHGSATERWHNILRTGLDFAETTNGRAYGHGVYFAADAQVSLGGYSRPSAVMRNNADYRLDKAVAVVELVNVPSTFVSSCPYYVVNKVKQMKPFLLIVQTQTPAESSEGKRVPEAKPVQARRKSSSPQGELFRHDPSLKMPTTYWNKPLEVRMPIKLTRTTYIDDDPDDKQDAEIFKDPAPPPSTAVVVKTFKPSPVERMKKLQTMSPPTETSIVASKALGKEFKALIKLQNEGGLPFYIDPETDSLYCWTLELFEFPASQLKTDMAKYDVKSIIAEIRFPATFPHSPPFMRILHPRCLPFIQGGGGNITGGGSVCNEILTATGWNPAFCVEAIVRDIMTNMTEATPPARLDPNRWDQPYTLAEAVEAFKRVARAHGWAVPKDFDKLSR